MTDTQSANTTIAFDRASARSVDADGRMRVRDCVITVAEINPYYGREIPDHERLGLNPSQVYDLYRDPAALEAAVEDFNGQPLLIRHILQTADAPRKEYVAGSVFNARWDGVNVRADLLVTDRRAIEYIESGELADLSSSYRYRADMTPITVNGRKADGVMRDIRPNHVALVEDGRATGAHVADSALKPQTGDHTVELEKIGKLLAALTEKVDGCMERIAKLEAPAADEQSEKDREDERRGEEEHLDRVRKDEADERRGEEEHLERVRKDETDERRGEEVAMDAASVRAVVAAAVQAERERARAVESAKRDTRHVLGDTIAMDSAGEIYRAALEQSGVDVTAIAAGAEQIAWQAYNVGSRSAVRGPIVANDSKNAGKPLFNTDHIKRR